jgi:hypothetical protein
MSQELISLKDIFYMSEDGLERLLDYDGVWFWLADSAWSLRFRIHRVEASPDRPAGIKYSFTLHDECGDRLLGFDNAHAVKASTTFDHRHRFRNVRLVEPYDYQNEDQLLSDFFAAVEGACNIEGIPFEFDDRELFGDFPMEDDDGT